MIDSTVTVPASRSVSTTVLLVSSLLRFLLLSSACTSLLASKTLRLSLAAKMTTVASLFRVARCGAETSLIRMMRFVMQKKLATATNLTLFRRFSIRSASTCKELGPHPVVFQARSPRNCVFIKRLFCLLVVKGHLFDFVAKHGRKDLVDSRSFVNSGHGILSESVSEAEGNNGVNILVGDNFCTPAKRIESQLALNSKKMLTDTRPQHEMHV